MLHHCSAQASSDLDDLKTISSELHADVSIEKWVDHCLAPKPPYNKRVHIVVNTVLVTGGIDEDSDDEGQPKDGHDDDEHHYGGHGFLLSPDDLDHLGLALAAVTTRI